MHFEDWQVICLAVGGGIWILFSILTAIRNSKAKKAREAASKKSFYIDPNPETEGENSE